MAASKKPVPFSRLRYSRSRKNGLTTTEIQKSSKSSAETNFPIKNRAYPLYFTVDDLATCRRKNLPEKRISDNLRPFSGKFCYKSEYKKKFRSFTIAADDSIINWKKKKMKTFNNLKSEGKMEFHPEYAESFVEFPMQKSYPIKSIDQLEPEGTEFSTSTEYKDNYVMFKEARKAALSRQPTHLRVEGDFDGASETKEKFKEPEGAERSELQRRNTTLKLAGDIDLLTENNEKYIRFENVPRRKLLRRSSSLEIPKGDCLDGLSEYRHAFQVPKQYEKVPLIRSMENLHMEGKIEFDPEYKRSFTDHHVEHQNVKFRIRRKSFTESLSSMSNEKFSKYCKVKDIFDRSIKTEFSPEYKHSFIQYPVQRPTVKRPRTNLIPSAGIGEKESELNSKHKQFPIQKVESLRPSTHLKPEGKICFSPTYKKSFVNFKTDQFQSDRENENLQEKSFRVLNHLGETSNQNVDFAKINRSDDNQFKKGKRLPSSKYLKETTKSSDSENDTLKRPPFRLEVTNPDQVQKPFEKLPRKGAPFVVLDENNNSNQWTKNKHRRKWSPSWIKDE